MQGSWLSLCSLHEIHQCLMSCEGKQSLHTRQHWMQFVFQKNTTTRLCLFVYLTVSHCTVTTAAVDAAFSLVKLILKTVLSVVSVNRRASIRSVILLVLCNSTLMYNQLQINETQTAGCLLFLQI